jgi:cbb3-type cytochrome oxidase maturation protein
VTILAILIPVTLGMGTAGLAAFFWSLRSGQYEDLSGDAERILFDEDRPLLPARRPQPPATEETTK